MRRNWITTFHPVTRRRGVTSSVSNRNLNVQRPVSSWIVSAGFTPRVPVSTPRTRSAAGTSAATKRTIFASARPRAPGRKTRPAAIMSVELPEVHAGVHRRDLIAVAVEHQRLRGREVARDALLGRLAPARMIDVRIHVRVEAVLAGIRVVPRRVRHLVDEADADDRLDVLEPVLPRHHEADRRAVLVHQRLAVEPDGEERQRVHRLVHAQPFGVWPVEAAFGQARHLLRAEHGLELDEARLRLRIGALDHGGERKADPRDHHRPRFDAAEAIDALLEFGGLDDVVERVVAGLVAEAVDLHRPRRGLELPRVLRRVAFADPEFVVVVVARDLLELVQRLGRRHHLLGDVGNRRLRRAAGGRAHRRIDRVVGARDQCPARDGPDDAGAELQELAAAEVPALVGDLRVGDLPFRLEQHEKALPFTLTPPGPPPFLPGYNPDMSDSPIDPRWPKILSLSVHEFRTPMTVVSGYIRMLLKERAGALNDQQRRLLEEAEKSCGRLSGLVSEVSELSNLEAGTLTFNKQRTDLRAALRQAVEHVPPMTDRDIAIALELG